MRRAPAPRNGKARQPDRRAIEGQVSVGLELRRQLEGRLRFERLLTDLSATFVNVAADLVDAKIEQALEQLVDFLAVERSSFGQFSEDNRAILVTHSFVAAGYQPFPPMILDKDFPWYAEQVRRGEGLRFSRLPDELPAEAVSERAHVVTTGMKSHLAIPLKAGGVILGAIAFAAFREFRAWPDE